MGVFKIWGAKATKMGRIIKRELGLTPFTVDDELYVVTTDPGSSMLLRELIHIKRPTVPVAMSVDAYEDEPTATVVKIECTFKGKPYTWFYNFGLGYPISSAQYMFEDGSYSCDCNRELFMSRIFDDIPTPADDAPCTDDRVADVVLTYFEEPAEDFILRNKTGAYIES